MATVSELITVNVDVSALNASGTAKATGITNQTATSTAILTANAEQASSGTPGVIQLTGDLGVSATNPQVVSTHLTAPLPLAQGGTGSSTQNFVDLTTAQTIAGVKTLSNNLIANANGGGQVVFGTSNVGIGITPTSILHTNGAIATPFANKTAAYTLTATDSILSVDATTAAFTVTLPDATTCVGRLYTIKKIDSSANAVTLATSPSTQTIDGATTKAISGQWTAVKVVSNGANWLVV